jgi:hypothetical protein
MMVTNSILSSHQTFASLLDTRDVSRESSPLSISSSVRTQRRLHRTRQSLSTYRHDLLVALRVVNRIEQEVLVAEYENWLRDEVGLCDRIGGLLGGSDGESRVKIHKPKDAEERIKRYCVDCRGALRDVESESRGLI